MIRIQLCGAVPRKTFSLGGHSDVLLVLTLIQEAGGYQRRAVFSLEAPSPAVCLLIQLEKHVTEEGGVTPSVYTRKEPVSMLYRV